MIICITSEGSTLEANVDQRFGRCKYFIFYDDATLDFEAVENKNIAGTGGVGIQSAQLVAEKQAKVVLTGAVGPNASQTLQAAGIDSVVDVAGTVMEAIDKYKNKELKISDGPNVEEKSGLDK